MTRTLGPWRSPNRSVKRPVPSLARFESEDQFWLAVRELSDLSQLARRPGWLPDADAVSQTANAMMAADEPDTRGYGLGLLELAKVVVPSES